MSGLVRDTPHGEREIWRRTLPIWLALMGLLAATLVLAYVPLGGFNPVVALGIAAVKAALVAVFFMHLKRPDPLLRLAGCAALLWLFFMFSLTFGDLLSRQAPTQPGTVTPRDPVPAGATAGSRAF
jgi:cytochrome c oxidase subunit IV